MEVLLFCDNLQTHLGAVLLGRDLLIRTLHQTLHTSRLISYLTHWSYSTVRKYSKPYLRTLRNNPRDTLPYVRKTPGENIRLGPVLTDRESVPTLESCSPVRPFLRFLVTEPSRMKSVRTDGCPGGGGGGGGGGGTPTNCHMGVCRSIGSILRGQFP